MEFFSQYSFLQYVTLISGAIIIGINKTGMPGIGTLPVVMLALAFPANLSTGIQLLMLATADIMAVSYYRISGDWKLVLKLLPCAVGGLLLGSFSLRYVNDELLRQLIGGIILFMAVLGIVKDLFFNAEKIPNHPLLAGVIGATAGFTTQVANAAGPVMALYLLAMRLPKKEYMGTSVLFFLLINWIKMPIFIFEGRINLTALKLLLPMIPFLLLGAWLGVVFIRKAPQKLFNAIIQILVIISAIKLLFS